MIPRVNRATLAGPGSLVVPVSRFETMNVVQIAVSGTAAWGVKWTLANVQKGETPVWVERDVGTESGFVVIPFSVQALLLEITSGDGAVTWLVAQSKSSRSGAGGGATWDPAQLFVNSEIGGWYDVDDFGTMFQDSAATTPVTEVGQPVGYLGDKSGNAYPLRQASDSARPILRQDAFGRHYLELDGSNDSLVAPGTISVSAGFATHYVATIPDSAAINGTFNSIPGFGMVRNGDTLVALLQPNVADTFRPVCYSQGDQALPLNVTTSSAALGNTDRDSLALVGCEAGTGAGGTNVAYLNGAATTFGAGGALWGANAGPSIAAIRNRFEGPASTPINFYGGVLVDSISPENRSALLAYYADRYGITLA